MCRRYPQRHSQKLWTTSQLRQRARTSLSIGSALELAGSHTGRLGAAFDHGIRVNAVAPGPFWTPLQVSGGQTMQNLEHFGERPPMNRPGQPVELAPTYVLLASRARYITGQIYGAMGGEGQP